MVTAYRWSFTCKDTLTFSGNLEATMALEAIAGTRDDERQMKILDSER
jgi:hypothetical protein